MIESCETCECYHEGVDVAETLETYSECGEHGSIVEKSRFFPFHPAPGCYRVSFWHTRFANILDGSKDSSERALREWKEALKHGEWILPEITQ